MEYVEALADLLDALKDQDLETIGECAEVIWNLSNSLIPVTNRESYYVSLLSDELEKVAL